MGLLESRLQSFFNEVGGLHATNVLHDLPSYLPLMQRYPHVAKAEIHRFRSYLTSAPADNLAATFQILNVIANHVPEVRDEIIERLGDALYEYKLIIRDLPANQRQQLEHLLTTLGMPLTGEDSVVIELVRSLTVLKCPAIVVAGAGFSYDAMPVTTELMPLLVGLLTELGVPDPVQLIRDRDQELWRIVKQHSQRFTERFAGWSARSSPCPQHRIAVEMLNRGQITHIISFNWDDLFERAHIDRFGTPIPKVTDGVPGAGTEYGPSLWKLHGDVQRPQEEWIFPYDAGRIFDSLMASLEETVKSREPSHALIVGYSEWEVAVRERLIAWLEQHIPTVLRVRPNWQGDDGGIRDTAKRFFQRLHVSSA